jgi:hypothetical protein
VINPWNVNLDVAALITNVQMIRLNAKQSVSKMTAVSQVVVMENSV